MERTFEDPRKLFGSDVGRAIADTLAESRQWQHRKVESLRLMEGLHGRRHVSIDCTPQDRPALAYDPADRSVGDMKAVAGLVMLPLAFIGKNTLRHFDITSADGRPMPVLSRRENGEAALGALMSEIVEDADFETDRKADALRRIVYGEAATSIPLVEELLDTGTVGGVPIAEADGISAFGARLARDLAENFVLIGLLRATEVGQRQIIKYSFHWRVAANGSGPGFWDHVLVFGGFSSLPLDVEVSGPAAAASYHLEVHSPPGLLTAGLHLPKPGRTSEGFSDESFEVIAHAVGAYLESPGQEPARLHLSVPKTGFRLLTALVLFYTASVIALALFLPNAKSALFEASDGAAAILLAVPAVVVALLGRPGENAIASRVLMPYRATVVACSVALVAVGASIVGRLHEPFLHVLWCGCFLLATVSLVYLAVGLTVGEE